MQAVKDFLGKQLFEIGGFSVTMAVALVVAVVVYFMFIRK